VRPSTIRAFEQHFGVKNVIAPCYGLAEATLAVAIWPFGVPIRLDPSGRFVSVGRPCRDVGVTIMAPREEDAGATTTTTPTDAGAPRAPDALRLRTPTAAGGLELPITMVGEICVRGPGVMRGYYNNPEATARVLSPDGWLRTGDLGFLDAEGYLYVTGRLKDIIFLGGENLAPTDVEDIVDHVAGIRYSAAVGLESERTGSHRLYVVAEVRDEAAGPDVHHRLVSEIVRRVHEERGHRPARVLLVRAGTIPKTSSGKIQHGRLGDMLRGDGLRGQLVHTAGAD
jgi:fatty-acyl-CoA synthase